MELPRGGCPTAPACTAAPGGVSAAAVTQLQASKSAACCCCAADSHLDHGPPVAANAVRNCKDLLYQLLHLRQAQQSGYCRDERPAAAGRAGACARPTPHLLLPLLDDHGVDALALFLQLLQPLDALTQQRLLGFPARDVRGRHPTGTCACERRAAPSCGTQLIAGCPLLVHPSAGNLQLACTRPGVHGAGCLLPSSLA